MDAFFNLLIFNALDIVWQCKGGRKQVGGVGVNDEFPDFLAGNRGYAACFYCAPVRGNDLQNSFQPSAFSPQPSALSFQLSAFSYQVLVSCPRSSCQKSGDTKADSSLTTPELKDVRGPVRSE
jgi:hypothetical protein